MKRLLIVGAGGHGRSVAEAVLAAGKYELVGFVDDAAPSLQCAWDLPVFGAAADLTSYDQYADAAIVAIGDNRLREEFHQRLYAAGFELATVVHPNAIVSPRAVVGAGCAILAGALWPPRLNWAQASSLIAVLCLTTNAGLRLWPLGRERWHGGWFGIGAWRLDAGGRWVMA